MGEVGAGTAELAGAQATAKQAAKIAATWFLLTPSPVVKYHGSVVLAILQNVTSTRSPKSGSSGPQRQISLLFDVFVLNQRLRTLLSVALAGTGMRPDEYAVYSLLFEVAPLTPTEMSRQMGMPLTTVLDYLRSMRARGHLNRIAHATDGRAYELRLTDGGLAAFHRASNAWNRSLSRLEPSLSVPVTEVRRALHSIDDAAESVLRSLVGESLGKAG
jgi:DNA-binding MarR family transcriptional regulator